MSEDRIGKALRSLPRATSSPGFSRRVMARIEAAERSPGTARPWRSVAIAACAVIVAMLLGSSWEQSRQRKAAEAVAAEQLRIESMRREYFSLERELAELRALAAASRPVVGVEGSGDFDYLIDLRNLYADRNASGLSTPAGFSPRSIP